MRTLKTQEPRILQITLVSEPANLEDDNVDVWVDLIDGRRFSFTVFTLRNLEHLMANNLTFVSPGMLIVARLSDDAVIEAIQQADALGIEQFGVLQTSSTAEEK